MGIIQKQSIKGLIYSYLGVVIGFITTGFLMPRFMQQDEIGLLRVIVSYATLLAQFSSLGFTIVAIKVFPIFRDPDTKNHGFFGLFSLVAIIGFIISMAAFYLYYEFNLKLEASNLLNEYILFVVPITFFILLFLLFDSYYIALYDAIKGSVLKELVQRLLILIFVSLFILQLYNLRLLIILYSLAFAAPPILMLVPLIKNKSISFLPDFDFLTKKLKKKILNVSLFGLVTSFSGIIVINIDVLMVERYLDLSSAGIYTIAFFFGTLVSIPSRPLTRISGIIVAESFKDNDLKNIDLIYKKSSNNLTIIGLLIFLGLIINMENIFAIIGDDYKDGYYVILLIAFANVIQMSAGTLNQIIFYSEYYRYSSYFIVFYSIILIVSNIVLIPIYGITGAAVATLLSKTIYIFSRILFVKYKLQLYPYQLKLVIPIITAIFLFWIQSYLPNFDNYIIDILVRSTLVSIIFGSIIYFFRVSDDINLYINEFLKSLRK